MTPEEIADIPDFTDAELLKVYRQALLDLAWKGRATTAHDGRHLTRADEKFVRETIEWLEARIDEDDDDQPGDVALAVFLPAR